VSVYIAAPLSLSKSLAYIYIAAPLSLSKSLAYIYIAVPLSLSLSLSLALSTQMHMTMAIIKGLNSIRYLDSSLTRANLGKSNSLNSIKKIDRI